MPTLYVTEPGSRVEKEYGRLIVVKDDEVLLATPLRQVSEVVLVGYAGVTTPALLALLDANCSLSLVTRSGKLRGRLHPAEARNLPLRHKQYACSQDPAFCLEISRRIVQAKLKNSRVLLQRMLRGRRGKGLQAAQGAGDVALERLNRSLQQAAQANDLAELRGLEGSGARAYFGVLRAVLRPELTFEKRTRRPPGDPANAILSLGYSLLTQALFTACQVAGLDAYDGFFHADKYGRPALALDLVEEFRAVVADSLALLTVNKRILQEQDFDFPEPDADQQGVYLSRRGLKVYLRQFTQRLNSTVYHPLAGRALSYQKVFEVQARQLRQAIEQGRPELYQPFLAR